VGVGDLLVFSGVGGRLNTSASAVRYLGAFMRVGVGTNGAVIDWEGLPNAAIFVAHESGQASIDVITGTEFGPTSVIRLIIVVARAQSAVE